MPSSPLREPDHEPLAKRVRHFVPPSHSLTPSTGSPSIAPKNDLGLASVLATHSTPFSHLDSASPCPADTDQHPRATLGNNVEEELEVHDEASILQEQTPLQPTPHAQPPTDSSPTSSTRPLTPGSDSVVEEEADTQDQKADLKWEVGSTGTSGGSHQGELPKMQPAEVEVILNRNNIFTDDIAARSRGQSLIKQASDILEKRRQSGKMADDKAQKLVNKIGDLSTATEATFLFGVWNTIHGDGRFVVKRGADGTEPELSPEQLEQAVNWIERDWLDDDRLRTEMQATFHAESVPALEQTTSEELNVLLAEVPRISIPKPDLAAGFLSQAFDPSAFQVLTALGAGVTSNQWGTFWISEVKGGGGLAKEAYQQLARGSACVTSDLRRFIKAADAILSMAARSQDKPVRPHTRLSINSPGPDTNSFAFGMTLTTEMAKMWVSWIEVCEDKAEKWHIHTLDSYSLEKVSEIQRLRVHLNNIFDWGCAKRLAFIKDLCAKVARHLAALPPKEKELALKAAIAVKSAGKVQRTAGSKRARDE